MRTMLLLITLTLSLWSYATGPSIPLRKVGVLKNATANPSELKKVIAAQASHLQKLLNTDSRTYRVFVKEGEPKEILDGAVVYKEFPAKDVEFMWGYAQIFPHSDGPDFRVGIPIIAKKSYGIPKDGRFLIKLVPQMGETSGVQTADGSTIVSSYRFQLSEVEATNLLFFVDKAGTVFQPGM